MSLDNENTKTIRVITQTQKARSDLLAAVHALHLAIAVAVRVTDEDLGQGKVRDRFSSALELAGQQAVLDLSEDEKDQYQTLHKYFQEMLQLFGNP